jgi:TolB-like protein
MKKAMFMSALILLLSACSQTSKEGVTDDATNEEEKAATVKTQTNDARTKMSQDIEKGMALTAIVADLAEQLDSSLSKENRDQTIALTSLVELEDFYQSSWLGKAISEQFFNQLHLHDLKLLDYKLTDTIMVTKKGDFALTQDWKKLKKHHNIERILVGTISHTEEGAIVNVRIINADQNIVEATSTAFVPKELFEKELIARGAAQKIKVTDRSRNTQPKKTPTPKIKARVERKYIARTSLNKDKDQNQVLLD